MRKQILIDCDGVLLEWSNTFIEYMKTEENSAYLGGLIRYNIENFFDMPKDAVIDKIIKFNDGHWRFGTLTPYKDATKAISILAELGYSFVVITSCSTESKVVNLRRANLYNIYGDVFEKIHCIGLYKSKIEMLQQYEPTFWIEDTLSHAIDGANIGHKAILLNHEWNQDNIENSDAVHRCMNWAEIVEYVLANSST